MLFRSKVLRSNRSSDNTNNGVDAENQKVGSTSHQENQNANNMDPPYVAIPEQKGRTNNPSQVKIPPAIGFAIQNQLVSQLTPIFDHLVNVI